MVIDNKIEERLCKSKGCTNKEHKNGYCIQHINMLISIERMKQEISSKECTNGRYKSL